MAPAAPQRTSMGYAKYEVVDSVCIPNVSDVFVSPTVDVLGQTFLSKVS